MCDETFAVQSVFRFHIQNVHTASISTITEACEIRDHSCQNDLLVQFLHADDTKGSRCGKCEKNPTEKDALNAHVSAAHAANASVQTEEKIDNYLAIQAQDSYKMPKTFEGYMCFTVTSGSSIRLS